MRLAILAATEAVVAPYVVWLDCRRAQVRTRSMNWPVDSTSSPQLRTAQLPLRTAVPCSKPLVDRDSRQKARVWRQNSAHGRDQAVVPFCPALVIKLGVLRQHFVMIR